MCKKSVQIEIVNKTKQTQQALLFLPAVDCNVKGVQLAALGNVRLASGRVLKQVINRYKEKIYVAGSQAGNHLFACSVPPEYMAEVQIRPICAVALGDGSADNSFHDIKTLKKRFRKNWSAVNLTPLKTVRFTMNQDQESGNVTLHCDCIS